MIKVVVVALGTMVRAPLPCVRVCSHPAALACLIKTRSPAGRETLIHFGNVLAGAAHYRDSV